MSNTIAFRDWRDVEYIALDVEGNGASPQELVEVALVPVTSSGPSDVRHEWMLRPLSPITSIAEKIHGISNEMVAEKPQVHLVSGEISAILADSPVIGHKVDVDCRLIKSAIPGWMPVAALDTWKLSKLLLPGLGSYSLFDVATELVPDSVDADLLHRAGEDARLAGLIFIVLADIFQQRMSSGNCRLCDIMEACGTFGIPLPQLGQQRSLFE